MYKKGGDMIGIPRHESNNPEAEEERLERMRKREEEREGIIDYLDTFYGGNYE